jgi:hypothetical protein
MLQNTAFFTQCYRSDCIGLTQFVNSLCFSYTLVLGLYSFVSYSIQQRTGNRDDNHTGGTVVYCCELGVQRELRSETSVSPPFSRVSTTVMADEHLPLLDACHIPVTVHLYKYWPLAGFTPTLCNCDTGHKIFPAFVCLPSRGV